MLGAYNHDGSDSMTDHFDVKFYGNVDIGDDLERDERDAIRADETLLSLAAAVRANEEGASERLTFYLAKQYGETLCGDDAAPHRRDEDCAVGADGACIVCGVAHGDPCDCGGRGFHRSECAVQS